MCLLSIARTVAQIQVGPVETFHERGSQLLSQLVRFTNDSSAEASVVTSRKNVGLNTDYFKEYAAGFQIKGDFAGTGHTLPEQLLTTIKGRQFSPGSANVATRMTWDKDSLLKEETLNDVKEIDLVSKYTVENPSVSRIRFYEITYAMASSTGKTYSLHVSARGKTMTVYATGDYTYLLPKIIQAISPQQVSLSLSPDDKRRLMTNTNLPTRLIIKFGTWLESVRYGALSSAFTLPGEKKTESSVIKMLLPVVALRRVTTAIGRSLFNPPDNDETSILSVSKRVSNSQEILLALKKITKLLEDFVPNVAFRDSLLNTDEAKEILDKEIRELVNSYAHKNSLGFSGYFGMNTHIMNKKLLKRLAVEHFGKEIIDEFDARDSLSFIEYVRTFGYTSADKTLEFTQDEPDYIKKEKTLLTFFLQSYAKKTNCIH